MPSVFSKPENEFKKYSSIINHDNPKMKRFDENEDKINSEWYVQEKLDGANMSIYSQDGKTLFGRRNGPLKDDEKFHDFQSLIPDLESKFQNMLDRFGSIVRIYGELIGCSYNNMPVKEGRSRFQKKVEYTNELAFITFGDVTVNGKYLNTSLAIEALTGAGFLVVPTMKKYSTLNEALNHPETFKSTIPDFLEMPEHPGSNLAEGIVIRPEVTFYCGDHRAIFKKKTPSFKETTPRRKNKNHNRDDYKLCNFLDDYITENRVIAVKSKELETITRKEFEKLFIQDIFDELKDEDIKIDNENRKKYEKHIRNKADRFLWKIFPKKKENLDFLDEYITEDRINSTCVDKKSETITRKKFEKLFIQDIFDELKKKGIEINNEKRNKYEKHIRKTAGKFLWKIFPKKST